MRDSTSASIASGVLAPLEVLRRCVWNMFRLESEQLKNCEMTRAVRDVDFPETSACLPEHVLREWRLDLEELNLFQHYQNQNYDHHCKTRTPVGRSCTQFLLTCLTRVEGDTLSVEDTEKLWLKCVKSGEELAHL
ncbi:solute carrier family 53 member 1-like [Engraulis encrasicolus]|uniref:solute carrier family 53 member 1-like n=1 Tax=Engraulis encrasicolus TaxID=184585 RepID=UPI002FD54A58